MILRRLMGTHAPVAVVLVRLAVGAVFLSEGIQKFLYPAELGPDRFAKIGFAAPWATAYFVASVEVVCGALILIGLFTRLAAVPLVIDMIVAIGSTKVPILLGRAFWGFAPPSARPYGFWKMAHEARTDYAMLLGALFLFIVGGGALSMDRLLARPKKAEAAKSE